MMGAFCMMVDGMREPFGSGTILRSSGMGGPFCMMRQGDGMKEPKRGRGAHIYKFEVEKEPQCIM
jgi:hypothetical protein